MHEQRFAFAGAQKISFALLAVPAAVFIVAGLIRKDMLLVGTGAVFVLLAAYIGRQAFGPPQSYVIGHDAFRHMRGDEVVLAIPWNQVTNLRIFDVQPGVGRIDQLAFDVADTSQVLGAHKYRNTKKLTGHDIVVNFGPLGGRSREAAEAVRRARSAAAGGF